MICTESVSRCRRADEDDRCEDSPSDGVFGLELGSEVRSESTIGGCGDLDGLDECETCEEVREGGKDDREVRRLVMEPFEYAPPLLLRDETGIVVAMLNGQESRPAPRSLSATVIKLTNRASAYGIDGGGLVHDFGLFCAERNGGQRLGCVAPQDLRSLFLGLTLGFK